MRRNLDWNLLIRRNLTPQWELELCKYCIYLISIFGLTKWHLHPGYSCLASDKLDSCSYRCAGGQQTSYPSRHASRVRIKYPMAWSNRSGVWFWYPPEHTLYAESCSSQLLQIFVQASPATPGLLVSHISVVKKIVKIPQPNRPIQEKKRTLCQKRQ
jgi:hypothetical protein